MEGPAMGENRLGNETSPYLLQHKDNPVHWWAWGPEALAEAQRTGKPILLSVGYAACHWCHVMAHESFEDAATAGVMNDLFVNIKVDREERPDIDAIYMGALHALGEQGGWPLTMFLDAQARPVWGGTYFPREHSYGRPAFTDVLRRVAQVFREEPEKMADNARQLTAHLARATAAGSGFRLDDALIKDITAKVVPAVDPDHGGLKGAPKFPQVTFFELIWRGGIRYDDKAAREAVIVTLDNICQGGIYDHLGGGFARYSVDAEWLVPHFEKMLYDNALLARAYLHGYQVLDEPLFRDVATETLDWMLREMRGPEGGFMSALHADSEGVEGKFYVWTLDEIRAVLGDDADAAIDWFGATEEGNFEGSNILTRGDSDEPPPNLADIKKRLYDARAERVWPGMDDKRLTAWNALAIAALADAGASLDRPDYVDAAVACAEFIWESLRDDDGHLLRTWKDGQGKLNGYLQDHSFLLEALLLLYEATFDPRWFTRAREVADAMIARFADDERGGFFETSSDHEQLVARRKDLEDNPIPSGNSAAAYGLLRLAALTGEHDYERRAVGILELLEQFATTHPQAFAHLLQALDFHLADVKEIALAGDDVEPLAEVVRATFRPHVVVAGGAADGVPLMEGRVPVDGKAAAYVCENFACQRPVTEPSELEQLLT
jgi:uncharacterized protein YyaL (SSP411 family)